MENSFQTSFIPKKPITSVDINKRSMSLFMILAIAFLVVVSILAGGLFFYKRYLTKEKEVLSSSLLRIKDSFEKETIDELELFDKRTNIAKTILDSHIVLSPLFELIGDITLPSVQFTKFDHQTNEKGFFVKMSGIAQDYRSVALQADVFNSTKGRYFKNVVFLNLLKDKDNNVTFNVEFNVDPSVLSYEKNILLMEPEAESIILPSDINNN